MSAPGLKKLFKTSQGPLKLDGGALLELLEVVHRQGGGGR